jgi:hypothetical protein
VIHATKRIPAISFSNVATLVTGNGVNAVYGSTMETILPTMTTMIGNLDRVFNLPDVYVLLKIAVLLRRTNLVRPAVPKPVSSY